MSILDRILGRSPAEGPQIQTTPRNAPAATPAPTPITDTPPSAIQQPPPAAASEGVVRVYDQFGRAHAIGREAWRRDVLLPNLQANRGNPDTLHELIAGALNDDFAADALEAARWLAETDPQPRRGANLLGAALLQLRDFAAARDVLESAITRHGESPHLLANLARAFAALGDDERARELIWRALELDPNDASALDWLVARLRNSGAQAVMAAYARAAALPGSWRAQLFLARDALERGDLATALRLYEEALGRAHPVPADLLLQLSGDLGNRGQAELLIKLTQPRFDLQAHGLVVGNNLMRAYLELGMFAEARKLLEQLYALQRPDWREQLEAWEQKLDESQKRYGELTAPVDVTLIRLEQPVWARGVLGFDALLPAKSGSAPRIHFVCGSGEAADDPGSRVISQPTNELGRLTRALPMFFAEEMLLRTSARTAFLLPWMKQGGFILSARPWTRAFLPPDHAPPDLLVFLHVDARATPWLLRVTIENLQREAPPVVFEQAFSLQTAGRDVLALFNDLLPRLTILLALRREEAGDALAMPPPELLPAYLAGLEQALAVGIAARQPEAGNFLHQERSIFDHLLDLAVRGSALLRPRLLLVNALENQSRRRPDIAREYLGRLALLERQTPVPEGAGRELVARGVRTLGDKAGE